MIAKEFAVDRRLRLDCSNPSEMSPRRMDATISPAARATLGRLSVSAGVRLRDERTRRGLTLDDVAGRAGVGRSTLHRVEMGEPATLETYARIATALSLRADLTLADPTHRDATARRDQDLVHAAMGELEVRQFRSRGRAVAIDEPYQHYQFAGRADVVAWDQKERHLLHIENRTRFPNVQEAAGVFNAKRAYFPAAFAERLGLRAWRSVTHVIAALWSSETMHTLRLRRATFESLCPDRSDAFAAWWDGEPVGPGVTSTLILVDPAALLGRKRRWVGLASLDRVEARYRGYADAARALSR